MASDGRDTFLQVLECALAEHPEWYGEAVQRLERSQSGRLLDLASMAHRLSCSAEHIERLVTTGELKEGRDYIDVGSKVSTRRMLRFLPDQVLKSLAKPARKR